MGAQMAEDFVAAGDEVRIVDACGRGFAASEQRREFRFPALHQRGRPASLVEQALDQAQALELISGIEPFAVLVALGRGESIAPLPHAQGVLGEPGIPLHRGNRVCDVGVLSNHFVLDKHLTDVERNSMVRASFNFV